MWCCFNRAPQDQVLQTVLRACRSDNPGLLLKSVNSNYDNETEYRATPLAVALLAKNTTVIDIILQAVTSQCEYHGNPFLLYAVDSGVPQLVSKLLAHGHPITLIHANNVALFKQQSNRLAKAFTAYAKGQFESTVVESINIASGALKAPLIEKANLAQEKLCNLSKLTEHERVIVDILKDAMRIKYPELQPGVVNKR